MSADSIGMSRNHLEILLLGLPVNELGLLQAAINQSSLTQNTINIDLKRYAETIMPEISKKALYNLTTATAQSLLHRTFNYEVGAYEVTTPLLLKYKGSLSKSRLSIVISDYLFDALTAIPYADLIAMLDKFMKPPVCRMSRAYSAKLYLLITDLKHENNTVVINYEELRIALGLAESSYALIHNFKRRVLNPAIKDINESGFIDVSCSDITNGRKITDFKFTLSPKF